MQRSDFFLLCDEGQSKQRAEKQVSGPCSRSMAVSWQNTFGGLGPYLTHIVVCSWESKEWREGSFLLSWLRRAQKKFFNISYSTSSWY